jgi:hypothetical protein
VQVSKSVIIAVLALVLVLVAALAFVLGKSSQPTPTVVASAPQTPSSSAPESTVDQKVVATTSKPEVSEQTVAAKAEKPKAKSEFSEREQRLIDAFFKGEDMCRGSSDEATVAAWCPRRDAAYIAMTNAGICYGHERDQSAADYKIHRCRKGSNR